MLNSNYIDELKYYIKNSSGVLKFTVFLVLFFVINYFVNSSLIENDPLIINKDVKTLLMGDSQVIHGCDPEVIDSSINIGQDGSPIIINYYLLKFLIKNNPQIKNVVLNVSYNTFLKKSEDKFLNKSQAQQYMSISYPFMDYTDFNNIDFLRLTYFEVFLRNKCIPNYSYWRNLYVSVGDNGKLEYPYNSYGFIPTKHTVFNDWNDTLYFKQKAKEKYYGKYDKILFGEENNSFLDSCAMICSKNNIKLYVVLMPIEHRFLDLEPKIISDYVENKMNYLTGSYSCLKVVNYSDIFKDEEYFSDYLHLNEKGAVLFSHIIKKELYN